MTRRFSLWSAVFTLSLSLAWISPAGGAPVKESTPQKTEEKATFESASKVVKGGISVEMMIDPVRNDSQASGEIMEGEDIAIGFKIVDTATGVPMPGLRPAAWIDTKGRSIELKEGKPLTVTCKDKISQFLQGSLAYQPEMDLTSYYILVMNEKPSITVLNPQLGFYVSKTVTTIPLKSPAEDWALTRDGKTLFVTMPSSNQLAVVDTATWKVATTLTTADNPVRVALQPDERYLWVGNNGPAGPLLFSGVTILDAAKRQVISRIETGKGGHELAFADDSSLAFVTNREEGTVSIVDVPKLQKVKDLKTGSLPVSADYSKQAKALYVAHEGDGKIVAIDGKRQELIATIDAKPGLRAIRFSPDGRWGFVLNQKESEAYIIDASVNRILHTVQVEPRPDQVGFTSTYAYIRSLGSNQVNAVQLGLIEKSEKLPLVKFAAGQDAPERARSIGIASVISPTPEFDVVLIANPSDKNVYYYMEGMLAPMGSFQNFPGEPRGIVVVDRSLKETSAGFYSSVLRLPHSGEFDVAFLMDSPTLYHCFQMSVKANPAIPREAPFPLKIEFLTPERELKIGKPFPFRVEVRDPLTDKPLTDLKDLHYLTILMPGISQSRTPAKPLGNGVYEADIVAGEPGYYKVFFLAPSRSAEPHQLPHANLRAVD